MGEVFGEHAEYIRTLPCAACHKPGPSDPHHVRSRGAGGKDEANLIPLCRVHHTEIHQIGKATFAKKWCIDLAEQASRYEEMRQRGDLPF